MNANCNNYKSITGLALLTAGILLIPFVAMQCSSEVEWSLSDFIFMGILIFGTGFTFLFITGTSNDIAYRVAIGFALCTGFFLIWVNLAVGIIGSENNPINLLYFGVIAVGVMGALLVRFKSKGMIFTMFAMALAQALVAVMALAGGYYQSPPGYATGIIGVNSFFITLFVVSALLFRYAAQGTQNS